ncbi:25S rRNA (adenine2142-N1)-methyltransferase [Thecaphora frezii]
MSASATSSTPTAAAGGTTTDHPTIAGAKLLTLPDGRTKLLRPRGKRGGAKNRKKTSSPSSSSTAATPAGKQTKAKKVKDDAQRTATEHSLRIAKYHTLEKQLANAKDEEEKQRIRKQQEELGGLEKYQEDSMKGGDRVKGGESGKWCAEQLEKVRGKKDIKILDVGAISGTSYEKFKWIHPTSIDLNPRSDAVQKCDFFDLPKPASEEDKFELVALSLVLNFVGDLRKRGEMLLHAHHYLRPGGFLYLVLPLPCVTNSRYLTHDHLRSIISSCGYEVLVQHDSKRLTRWLLKRKKSPRNKWDRQIYRKKELVSGPHRNNFAICLGNPEEA